MRSILHGMAAGAAGTTALNAATYTDMTARARPASDTPQQTVEAIEQRLPASIPGDGDQHQNRVAGLGSLSGIVTGVGIGAVAGLLRRTGLRLSFPVGAALTGLGAMAATDGSMAALRVSDPRTWSSTDWLSDVVPHLIYGAVTWAVLQALDGPGSA
ncbi:hypothetical protein [Mangrovihabitans endophyticus]|nr:hypothetical protein [Mangrovihabitans endophyticus]